MVVPIGSGVASSGLVPPATGMTSPGNIVAPPVPLDVDTLVLLALVLLAVDPPVPPALPLHSGSSVLSGPQMTQGIPRICRQSSPLMVASTATRTVKDL